MKNRRECGRRLRWTRVSWLVVLLAGGLWGPQAVGKVVFDPFNFMENKLNQINTEIQKKTGFLQLKKTIQSVQMQIQQVRMFKTRMMNFMTNQILGSWDPRVPSDYDWQGTASADYQQYQRENRQIYGKPWTMQDFQVREGDGIMAYHYARMDRHADHTDTKIQTILRKELPKADKMLDQIQKTYRYLITTCKGKSVDNDARCSSASRQQALVDMQMTALRYRQQMSQMLALIVQMQMLQQRRLVEMQKQMLRPGAVQKNSRRGMFRFR